MSFIPEINLLFDNILHPLIQICKNKFPFYIIYQNKNIWNIWVGNIDAIINIYIRET